MPDTAVLKNLELTYRVPDDVFKISFSNLHISGIGIDDLLSKDNISLKQVSVASPVIEVYHKKKRYNGDSITLYQKLFKRIKSIAVNEVQVSDARFIIHDLTKGKTNHFSNVSLNIQDVLIDSSTQSGKKRFLFATHAKLSVKNFSVHTPDSLYTVKFPAIHISAPEDELIASNVEIRPRMSREQFKKQSSVRKEMYEISIPTIQLTGINWWALANEGTLIANGAVIDKARCSVFLDRSLPFRNVRRDNFPHQLLMRIPVPVP